MGAVRIAVVERLHTTAEVEAAHPLLTVEAVEVGLVAEAAVEGEAATLPQADTEATANFARHKNAALNKERRFFSKQKGLFG
jgi:hypothetical protein